MAETQEGTVKWWNAAKGFGFITTSGGEDIFVEFKQIQLSGFRGLNEGQRVQFVKARGPKGWVATNVKPL